MNATQTSRDTSWYPHHRSPRQFIPLQQIKVAASPGEWHSLGADPLFALEGQLPLPGWNMLELDEESSVSGVVATLTLESSRRQVTFDFPVRQGKVTKRLVFVPFGVKRVTFVPMNAAGTFTLRHFQFVWLTPMFAHNRLLQRLANMHQHYRDLPLAEVKQSLQQQASKQSRKWQSIALEDYDSTFISMSTRRHYQQWIRQIEQRRAPSDHDVAIRTNVHAFESSVLLVCPHCSATNECLDDFKHKLAISLASLAEQALAPRRVLLLITPGRHKELSDWLKQWQRELSVLVVRETEALSVAAQRLEALSYCENTWVWFLRLGDRLAENALFYAACIAHDNPQAQMLIADEDSLDEHGIRHSPVFKPEYNPDLLLSMPYMGRAVCYQHAFVPRLAVESCAGQVNNANWLDYAQTLSVTRRRDFMATKLAHIPHIAYHGVPEQVSTSFVSLVQQHLNQLDTSAQVRDGLLSGTQRVRWPMPSPEPLVSLLVPTRNGVDILRPCVDAILDRTDYSHFELIILDNQSTCTETLAYLHDVEGRDSRVKVLHWDHPFNYSSINNFGAAQARGSIIGLINNDVEPIEGTWLTEMVEQVSRPEIGCVGAKLYYPNDTVQHGGVILGLGGLAGHAHRFFQRDEDGYMGRLKVTQNLSAVTAACLLLRKSVFDEVNGLNEADLAVAYNDVDLCIKVREAGYRNLWTPYAALYHHESISRGADDTPEKRARWLSEYAYMRKAWGELLDSDPAYNPNLTLVHEDFSLR
ncbi:MAG: glycosyltransferase family 2 protein [Halomonadaceae bacterium]|uniref:Glycosyltransferase n=1 Tax=Halomonas colorata TaxID=2742615 RepID=A0ABR9G299_9GAMM|nr:glycosyltransferase family 2 protein [Halomonas colorata]MBE0464999.1 glycosyltransferase [Halomonas colorata]